LQFYVGAQSLLVSWLPQTGQPHTHATSEYPLPQKQDEIVFYLLTDAGIFTATASKEDLSSHHRPLSKLHDAAQGIITEYRLVQGNK
jgi:hypothetical protein